MTVGEYRVGISFNPGGNPTVDEIKKAAAALIDRVREIADASPNPEVERLANLAADAFEDGAMWAVKAATKPSEST